MMALVLGFWLLVQASSPGLSGRVVDSNGQPVTDAAVSSQRFNKLGGYFAVKTRTAQDGRFSIAADGKVIFVRKTGFIPLTHILVPGEKRVRLVLEPLSELKTLRVARCQDMYGVDSRMLYLHKFSPKNAILYGEAHLYPVPNNAPVEHRSDTDYGAHVVSYPKGRNSQLFIVWGPLYIGDYPDIYLFDNVVAFTERALSTGEDTEDVKGTLKNGNRFRWVGASEGAVFYHDVSPDAAAYFDRIIDEGCILN